MAVQLIVPGLWEIPLGFVNAFLLDAGDGLTLIDTGVAGSTPKIVEAIRSIGRQPSDVRHILVTHCHSDHAGSLAELKRLTDAPASMHPIDALMVREGRAMRPVQTTPGLLNTFLVKFFVSKAPKDVEPASIDHEIHDGDTVAGGLRAIHVPGHCAGQLAFLWPEHGGVLIAADAAAHTIGVALSPIHEDLAEGKRSLAKLSSFDFEAAGFGHGKAIRSGASARFRRKWPQADPPRPVPSPG